MRRPVHITGAGVAGLAIAAELTARGHDVTLSDLAASPGPHACSWWAGGMLAPFCEGETAEEPVVRLGREAADWWDAHAGGVVRNGTLVVAPARDTRELDRFARRTEGHRTLDGAAVAALEPHLEGRFARALHFADVAHLDPRAALAALTALLDRRGVRTGQGDPPPGALRIDARGLAARDRLPDLRGVKGEMLVLRCPDVTLSRPVRLLHPRIPVYIVPREGGLFMVGATMIEASERGRATARSVAELINAAYALHPAFADAEVVEIGVDARPAFPDNLPRLRRVDGVLCANGLYRHGFLLAPALARMTAEHIEDETFRPEVMDDHPAQWQTA